MSVEISQIDALRTPQPEYSAEHVDAVAQSHEDHRTFKVAERQPGLKVFQHVDAPGRQIEPDPHRTTMKLPRRPS